MLPMPYSTLFISDRPTIMDSRVAFKILGDGLAADVLDHKLLQSIIIEFEFTEIGGKD